jgi:hypothetical protein
MKNLTTLVQTNKSLNEKRRTSQHWYKPTRVQIRNEEPHNTGISLKPTRVQIRNEEHDNTGSINQQELFQIRNVAWKSLTVQTVTHASAKLLKRRWDQMETTTWIWIGWDFSVS